MTKKVKMVINGKVKMIPESAVSLAQRFFGAAPVGAAKELPKELTQPLVRPKLGKPIELKKPEIKQPEEVTVDSDVVIAPDPIENPEPVVTDPNADTKPAEKEVKPERKKPVRSKKK